MVSRRFQHGLGTVLLVGLAGFLTACAAAILPLNSGDSSLPSGAETADAAGGSMSSGKSGEDLSMYESNMEKVKASDTGSNTPDAERSSPNSPPADLSDGDDISPSSNDGSSDVGRAN